MMMVFDCALQALAGVAQQTVQRKGTLLLVLILFITAADGEDKCTK